MEDNCYLLAHTVPPDKLTKARSRCQTLVAVL